MVWSIIGWFFLGLLALVVLILACPVVLSVRFSPGELRVRVRVLGVPITLLPAKDKKPKKPKKEKPAKQEKPQDEVEEEDKKPQKSFGQRVALIKRLVRAGLAALKVFFWHFRVYDVRLALPVDAGDAAATALRCGQLQAVVGGVRAFLDGRLRVKYKQLEIIPDFDGQFANRLFFSCKAAVSPGIILVMGAVFLFKYLRSRRPYTKKAYKRALKEKQAARAAAQAARAAAQAEKGQNSTAA